MHVFLRDEVLGKIPALEVASQDQLGFDLALPLAPRFGIPCQQIVLSIESDHFQKAAVGAVDILELHVEHGVDPVFLAKDAKAILPARAGKDGAVSESGLAM